MRQQITLVTGKGGVGKSLVAAAIALRESRSGKKVLLVELGKRSFYRDFLRIPNGADRSPLLPGVSIVRWEGRDCLREYVAHLFMFGGAADLFLNNSIVNALVGVAPGLNELALTGKITSGHRLSWSRHNYDMIVVDAYATGHFLALLRAPRGMYEAISVGPMGKQCKSIRAVLGNPEIMRYVVVSLAEELPVAETLELGAEIESETGIRPRVYCNKTLPTEAAAALQQQPTPKDPAAAGFLAFLDSKLETQRVNVARLEEVFDDLRLLPHCFEAEPSQLLVKLADHFETGS